MSDLNLPLGKKAQQYDLNQNIDYKIIKYEEITHVEEYSKFDRNDPNQKKKSQHYKQMIQPRWSFKFRIQTVKRDYELLAASEDERLLWIFAFNWIITEQNRLSSKKQEIEDTAQRFKNLTTKEKTEILAASLEYQKNIEKEMDDDMQKKNQETIWNDQRPDDLTKIVQQKVD